MYCIHFEWVYLCSLCTFVPFTAWPWNYFGMPWSSNEKCKMERWEQYWHLGEGARLGTGPHFVGMRLTVEIVTEQFPWVMVFAKEENVEQACKHKLSTIKDNLANEKHCLKLWSLLRVVSYSGTGFHINCPFILHTIYQEVNLQYTTVVKNLSKI